MCHPDKTHMAHGACCCGSGPIWRRFLTEEEKKKHLETYRDELKKEIAGLEERIQEFKN
jgi:hypothetical protein